MKNKGKMIEADMIQTADYLHGDGASLLVVTAWPWYRRLWVMITNPFTYIFLGYVRF